MSDRSINADELKELCDKVNQLELTKAQGALLDAILKLAWRTIAPEETLESEFDASFEPNLGEWRLVYEPGASAGTFWVKGSVSVRGLTIPPPCP